MRVRNAIGGVFLAGVLLGNAAGARAAVPAASPFMVAGDCQEEQAFVDGDAAAVAAVLPAHDVAVTDPASGSPLLFFRAADCGGVSIGDQSLGPGTMADMGVVIQSPDGRGCASAAPVLGGVKGDVPPVCNWYTLAWLSGQDPLVDWLRAGSPGFPAIAASGLSFRLGALDPAQGGAPYHFEAPSSTGDPFTMDAITRQRPGTLSVRGGYWVDTAAGTVDLAASSDTLSSGDATGTVSAPAGSPAARLMGAASRPYLPGYSGLSAEHWDSAVYRKQLLWAAPGETAFSGTCSFSGTVGFTPPASDTPQPLSYTYDATGTCSGALDGRPVSGEAVSLQQSGRSDGGCTQAQTVSPGSGVLRFASGETLDYTLDFTTDATQVSGTFYGDRSGIAPVSATFLTPRTSPTVTLDCATTGVQQVPMDLSFSTSTPLVSGGASGGSPSVAPAAESRTPACAGCLAPTSAAAQATPVALPQTGAPPPAGVAVAGTAVVAVGAALRGRRGRRRQPV